MPYQNSSNTKYSKHSWSCRKYKKWKWINIRFDKIIISPHNYLDLKITAKNLKAILIIKIIKEWVGVVFQFIRSRSMKADHIKVIFQVKMGQFLPIMNLETQIFLRKTYIVIIWLLIVQLKIDIDLT
jgi:hypothetical protein